MKNVVQNSPPLQWKTRLLLWLYFAVLLFNSPVTYAQLVNGDFESNCGTTTPNAFQTNSSVTACVTGPWFVSHGSPDIYYNIGAIGDRNTTASAHMWAKLVGFLSPTQEGEGLYIECPNFKKDVTYKLSFRYFATDLDNIYVSLAQGLTHRDSHFPTSYPVVTKEDIVHISSPVNATWTEISIFFTPTNDYPQLWFYPLENSTIEAHLFIDDVVIIEACIPDVIYTSFAGTPAHTEVEEYIQASGTSAVTAGQTIDFQAGDYIQLLPDFHAIPGTGYFHAHIAPCDGPDIQSCYDNGVEPLPKRSNNQGLNIPLKTSVANYPNPATGKTTISYTLAESGPVTLIVTNLLGEKVLELIHSNHYTAGQYSMEFDISALLPGMYFLTLQSGTTSAVQKIVVTP